jgi:hypothetical protein
MPEIRFTEEEFRKVDRGLREIDRRFESRFGIFRGRLDEDELALVKSYAKDVFRREALILLGLDSLYDALAAAGANGDRHVFVDKGLGAGTEAGMRADRSGLYDRLEDENDPLHKKLELTPHEQKRFDAIEKEVYGRYGLEPNTLVRPARTPEEKLRSVNVHDIHDSVDAALNEAGLSRWPADDLNNSIYLFGREQTDWLQEQLVESQPA